MSKLAIVVVNYESHKLIAQNLPVSTVAAAEAMVVVVDNYSTAEERIAISELCRERGWRLVTVPTNSGFGAAVNRGVRAAEAAGESVFVLLNPDAVISASVLSELAANASRDNMALISPLIDDSSGAKYFHGSMLSMASGQIRGGWLDGRGGSGEWRNWLTAACLAFHSDAFGTAGGMSEEYFLYWEDVDFSIRAASAGVKLVLRTDLRVVHDEGGTQGRRKGTSKSNGYYYYNSRNRLIFAKNHLSPSAQRKWLLETPRQSWQIWLRGGRRQAIERPSSLAAVVRGSLAGVIGLCANRRPGARLRTASTVGRRPTVLVAHPSSDLYGSDRVLLESISAFVEGGFRVVGVLPGVGELGAAIRARGGEVVVCSTPVLRKAALRVSGASSLILEAVRSYGPARRLVRSVSPDFIFVNTVTIPAWLVLARAAGIPVACHVHEAESSLALPIRRVLYAPLLLASRLVVNSKFTLGVLGDTWPVLRERGSLIYNGVPGPSAPTKSRKKLDGLRLLFVGRLSPRKGPQVAIDAVAQLIGEGIRAELTLVGSVYPGYEWFETQLREQVVHRGLSDSVRFVGFDPSIWAHLAAADIVLVPSIAEESFGNTAVESVLAERPAIVSSSSGLREAASGYAAVTFVEPADASAISEAVKDMMLNWEKVRVLATADRELALSRHAPAVYRANLILFAEEEMLSRQAG